MERRWQRRRSSPVVQGVLCTAMLFSLGCGDGATDSQGDGGAAAGDSAREPANADTSGKAAARRGSTGNAGHAHTAGRGGSSDVDSTTAHTGDPDADAGVSDPSGAFSIALSTSECLEGCPAYDLKLDQTGNVDFNGRGNTRQQGWSGKIVSPEAAADMLQALRAANYWQLNGVYRSRSDGCMDVAADRATNIWSVTMQGQTKLVVDYLGCTGVSELDALRQVPAMLRDTLKLSNWIGF